MSKFTDAAGQEWRLEFDGFLLDRIEREAKVDLADLSAGGLLAVERDAKALVRVLAVACEQEIRERGKTAAEFVKQIRKEAITDARRALLEALADFFPASEWSEMPSNLTKQRKRSSQIEELEAVRPAFMALPEEIKIQLFREEIAKAGSSPSSSEDGSASDWDGTLSTRAENSPANAESAPAATPSKTSG